MKFQIRKPRKHQQELIDFHFSSVMLGTLAWHGMGLGKTLSSLWVVREHLRKLRAMGISSPKFIVICPKSAISTWKKECYEQCPDIYGDMIITSISQLHTIVKKLRVFDARFLIIDESHYLKSAETKRAKQFAKFLETLGTVTGRFMGGRIMLLSGTPMPNSAAELYTSWAICTSKDVVEASKKVIDMSKYEDWREAFTQKKDINWVIGKKKPKAQQSRGYATKFEGVANGEKLIQLIAPFIHYKEVEECIDLPPAQIVPIDLGLAEDKLLKDVNLEEPEAYMALLERLARAKAPYLIEWVEEFIKNTREQLVVFSMYTAPIYQLQEMYPNHIRVITGRESDAERAKNLADFQAGVFQVFAMSYKCGSEALNLQNANRSIYLGYPWTDGMLKQAMARTRRSGQERTTFHHFLTSGPNDEKNLQRVLSKEASTNYVTGLLKTFSFGRKVLDDLF